MIIINKDKFKKMSCPQCKSKHIILRYYSGHNLSDCSYESNNIYINDKGHIMAKDIDTCLASAEENDYEEAELICMAENKGHNIKIKDSKLCDFRLYIDLDLLTINIDKNN